MGKSIDDCLGVVEVCKITVVAEDARGWRTAGMGFLRGDEMLRIAGAKDFGTESLRETRKVIGPFLIGLLTCVIWRK